MTEFPDYLEFYGAGLSPIKAEGMELSDSAAQYFMNHARNAVRRIESGDIPAGLDPFEPFRELGREVVREQPQSSYGKQGLRKASTDAIDAALRNLCPLWPFCD